MKSVFADSFYFLAILSADDEAHVRAVQFSEQATSNVVTTYWVLTEVADGLAGTSGRQTVVELIRELEQDAGVEIVPPDLDLWRRGLALYYQRRDKGWSLTDCISFTVMTDRDIAEALTGDHHFRQAGFRALLVD